MFKVATYPLHLLLDYIAKGKLSLPDIQRPFVWKATQVRDLFDSLYRGFPVGTLMLWETGAKVGVKPVGGGEMDMVPSLLIIDGQQRLTSLYSVIRGVPVMDHRFDKKRIAIAFRPGDETFEVAGAVTRSDPEFLSDITELWQRSFKTTVQTFLDRLEKRRGTPLEEAERDRLENRLDHVRDLWKIISFEVIEMTEGASEEDVAEIFIRINSKGVSLSQADFVLTLLSVHWERGRLELEEFSRKAKDPTAPGTPANAYLNPSPDQMLRVAVGLAFRRGRMQTIYQLLLGKDLATGEATAERREEQFRKLEQAQKAVLDPDHWRRFLRCLKTAGFHGDRMLTSASALLYSYLFWLIGKQDFGIDGEELQRTIARWFFMAHTTGRYTSSPETVIEADLRRIEDLPQGDSAAFRDFLDGIIDSTFTGDFWKITLPSRLDGTGHKSPALSAYWAALSILNAEVLFSNTGVRDLLRPERASKAVQERQSLFPHLQSRHIANFVFAEWPVGLRAGEKAPAAHWNEAIETLGEERRKRHMYWHALPSGWHADDHGKFLERRRHLMAVMVRDAFRHLSVPNADPRPPGSLADLLIGGETATVEFKSTAKTDLKAEPGNIKKQEPAIKHAIAKTICGFMNTDGGTLLIGVSDEGSVLGIEQEMSRLPKPNPDGYELLVRDILNTHLSIATAKIVQTHFEKHRNRTVCLVKVSAAPKAVYSKALKGGAWPSDFWVRDGNRTIQLHGEKADTYKKQRFD